MPVVRRRVVQGLALLGALTVLAGIGLGIYLGIEQVRRYIAAQDARIASLTIQLDAQRSLIDQQQDRIWTQAGQLIETRRDVERLRSGLGTLQNLTANQHSYTQLDIADLQNNLGNLRVFATGHQTDTSMNIANLRTYVDRVDRDAINADAVHDQRLDDAERTIQAAENAIRAVEDEVQTVGTKVAEISFQRIADRNGFDLALDMMPSRRIAAGLLPAWLLMLSTEWGGILGEDGQAETVRVRWSTSLDDGVFGDYSPSLHLIRIDEKYRGERPELLAALLAHEFHHATSTIPRPRTYTTCIEDEMWATLYEESVWNAFDLTPQTDAERGVQSILEAARRLRPADDTLPVPEWTGLRSYVEDTRGYRERCTAP